MDRVVLRRRGDGAVEARECPGEDGAPVEVRRLAAAEVAGWVRDRERTRVRWVWDDTTRWYPALLQAGVRVARCTDLRLSGAVLRRSPLVDRALPASADAGDGRRCSR